MKKKIKGFGFGLGPKNTKFALLFVWGKKRKKTPPPGKKWGKKSKWKFFKPGKKGINFFF